jgi:hypothetical protein
MHCGGSSGLMSYCWTSPRRSESVENELNASWNCLLMLDVASGKEHVTEECRLVHQAW